MLTKKIMSNNSILILMKNQKIIYNKTKIISKINLATIMFNKINSKIHIWDFRIWWLSSKTVNNKTKQIKNFKVTISKLLKTIISQSVIIFLINFKFYQWKYDDDDVQILYYSLFLLLYHICCIKSKKI